MPFEWEEARLTFSQKLALVGKPLLARQPEFLAAIRQLNTIRNRFGHNLRSEVESRDLAVFRAALLVHTDEGYSPPTETIEVIHAVTERISVYFAGAISVAVLSNRSPAAASGA